MRIMWLNVSCVLQSSQWYILTQNLVIPYNSFFFIPYSTVIYVLTQKVV